VQLALKHWSRILRRWPVDRVRPENVSFQKIMTQRLDKHKAQTSPSAAASTIKSNQAVVSAVAPRRWDKQAELEQANALYSLLEDRYAKEFPLPRTLRAPASNPTYYDDLVTEMQEAPTRSWFVGVMKRIKGSLRFA
jgi:cytochrome b pre-mRNA-processing protein 6